MKKFIYSIIVAGLALSAASCQNIDEQVPGKKLNVTGTIVNFESTKVSYAFSETDNPKSGLKASWEEGDSIFGFDNKENTFTFTVSEVSDGKATFSTGGYEIADGVTTLYAVYCPGETAFTNKELEIDLSSQDGTLDGESPVVMCATGTIENNNVVFDFTNQTSIVGIYKMQIKDGETPVANKTITGVTLNNVVTTGTVKVNDAGNLALVPGSGVSSISASDLSLTTDTDGYIDVDPSALAPYFAVIPAKAKMSVSATDGTNTYNNLSTISESTLSAGTYYYIGKKLGTTVVAKIGNTGYATIDDAFISVTDGQTITLNDDCNFGSQVTLAGKSGEITLDLNGHTLTNGPKIDNTSSRIYLNQTGVTLTIKDTQTGGTITSKDPDEDVIKVVKGILKVTSGTIKAYNTSNNGGNAAIWVEPETSGATTDASVTITGGNIEGPASVATSGKRAYALYVNNPGAAITVAGGSFSAQSNNLRIMNAKSVDITGGTFVGQTSGEFTLRFATSDDNTCVYNIGSDADVTSKTCAIYVYGQGVTLNVTGGKYKTTSETAAIINAETATGTKMPIVNVSSGLFSKQPKTDFVDAFHKIDDNNGNADYPFKVVDQDNDNVTLQIGIGSPRPCGTVEGAVNEANKVSETCVITLNSDYEVSKGVNITNSDVTIDLNNHILTYIGSKRIGTTEGCVLKMQNGTLTNDGSTNIVTMTEGGTIEMTDVNVTVPSGTYVAVMVNPGDGKTSTFKMNGGSINAGNASAVNVSNAAGVPIVEIDGAEISGNIATGAFRIESTCSDTNAKVEIKGNTKITSSSYALNLKGNVPCTISGGTLISTGGNAISVSGTGSLTVTDGEIEAQSASTGAALYLGEGSGNIIISGGYFHSAKATFNITGSSSHHLSLSGDCTVKSTTSNALYSSSTSTESMVTVTGGKFSCPEKAVFSVANTTTTKTKYIVSSCIFNGPDPAASRLAEGCHVVDNTDPATKDDYPKKIEHE